LLRLRADDELDATDFDSVARGERSPFDFLAVDPRAIRTAEIFDVQPPLVVEREPTVHARDECGVDNEVRACGPAHRLPRAWEQSKQKFVLGIGRFQNQHRRVV
jgi:hypothetical protein